MAIRPVAGALLRERRALQLRDLPQEVQQLHPVRYVRAGIDQQWRYS